MSEPLERIYPLSEVRAALRLRDNRSVRAACERFGVPILDISRQSKALRHSDYEQLLSRATIPAKGVSA